MHLQQIKNLINNYYHVERGYGRKVAGVFSFGAYGATEGIKALNQLIEQIQTRIRVTSNISQQLLENELTALKDILTVRWSRIRDTENSYLLNFAKATNRIYCEIATMLAEEIGEAPCIVLMPSIENSLSPISRVEFILSELNECMVTDDFRYLIPISEILQGYKMTYELKNPFTNQPFTSNELRRTRSHQKYVEEFNQIDLRISQLYQGISPEIIVPLKKLIEASFQDHPGNPPEIHFAELLKYIENLPDVEKNALFNAPVSESETFFNILAKLQPEDPFDEVCSWSIFGHYMVPFLNHIEKAAGIEESCQSVSQAYQR